jgi:hypothetical protein
VPLAADLFHYMAGWATKSLMVEQDIFDDVVTGGAAQSPPDYHAAFRSRRAALSGFVAQGVREWRRAFGYSSPGWAAAAGSIFWRVALAALLRAGSLSAKARLSSGIADLATAV